MSVYEWLVPKKKERGKTEKRGYTERVSGSRDGQGHNDERRKRGFLHRLLFLRSLLFSSTKNGSNGSVSVSHTLCLSRSLCCGMSAFSKRAKRIRFSRVEVSNPEHTPHKTPPSPHLKVERFFFRRDLFLSCNLWGTKKGS